ncbi:MAG: helix-turn-helix domain-containing protein [Betaproteobacteria bacterium]|nr:helix-turn-helix domain-containing protein [Betaproteobacteria bacterium]
MSNDPCSVFGLRLSEIRRSKGWSQERLAAESGLARSYVGGVERGQRNIALRNICKLAGALGMSPSVLFVPPDPPSGFGSRPHSH